MSESTEDPLKKFLPEGDEPKAIVDANDAIKRAREGKGSGRDLMLATLDAAIRTMQTIAMASGISPQSFVHILSGSVGGCVGGMLASMDVYVDKPDDGHKQIPELLEIARVNMEANYQLVFEHEVAKRNKAQ